MKIQINTATLEYNNEGNYSNRYFFKNQTFFAPFISSIDDKVYLDRNADHLYNISKKEAIEFGVDTFVREAEIPEGGRTDFIGKNKLDIYEGSPTIPVYLPYVIFRDQFRNEVRLTLPSVEKAQLFIDTVKQISEDYWSNAAKLTAQV